MESLPKDGFQAKKHGELRITLATSSDSTAKFEKTKNLARKTWTGNKCSTAKKFLKFIEPGQVFSDLADQSRNIVKGTDPESVK